MPVGPTWSRPGPTWSRPGPTWSRPGLTWSRPGRTWSRPGRTWSRPGRTWSRPGRTRARPGRTWSRPGRTWARPGRTWARPGRTRARPVHASWYRVVLVSAAAVHDSMLSSLFCHCYQIWVEKKKRAMVSIFFLLPYIGIVGVSDLLLFFIFIYLSSCVLIFCIYP